MDVEFVDACSLASCLHYDEAEFYKDGGLLAK
jgi:hypothetical protein